MNPGVLMFDPEAKPTSLLKQHAFNTYFVIDAHPNDQGYKIMAQEVGDLLMARDAGSRTVIARESK